MYARSLLAVALVALLAAPAAARAETKKAQAKPAAAPAKAAPAASTAAPPGSLSIGGWVGGEFGDLDGFQLRFDAVMPYQRLSPQVDLSFVGSIGYSRLGHSSGGADVTANILKFVPAARFTFPLNPELSLFGDAGLGLYWASVSTDLNPGFGLPTQSSSASDVGFMLRLGGGGFYKLNPRMQLGASFMIDPMFGDYEDTTFSILAGLTYQL